MTTTITTTPALDAIRRALATDPRYRIASGGCPCPYDEQGLSLAQDGIPQPDGWLLDVWSYGTDLAGVLYRPDRSDTSPRPVPVRATYTVETTR